MLRKNIVKNQPDIDLVFTIGAKGGTRTTTNIPEISNLITSFIV